ncbi:MAG: exo-alpha-sialidase [Pirellulaceae bacterium]|nr:exo-alpha-sialidase [Planctomycetales bacterium]
MKSISTLLILLVLHFPSTTTVVDAETSAFVSASTQSAVDNGHPPQWWTPQLPVPVQQDVERKAAKLADQLALDDADKTKRTSALITEHYARVWAWHQQVDEQLNSAWAAWDEARDNRNGKQKDELKALTVMTEQIDPIYAQFMPQIHHFLKSLLADIGEEKTTELLDRITRSPGADRTYNAYVAMVPEMTDREKDILWRRMAQAREESLAAWSDARIVKIFKKYKVRNEFSLDYFGYDYRLRYAAWIKRTKDEAPGSSGIVHSEFIYDQAPYPSCHAATIVETRPGQIVAAWFGGTAERHPDVGIWVSRHVDGKWQEPVEVANGIQTDGSRLPTWNPVLFQAPNGPLQLYYKVGPSPQAWWGMMKESTDEGMTWSDARRLGDGLIGPVKNKPLRLADGTIIAGSSTEDNGWRIHVERSADGGTTWRTVGPIPAPSDVGAIQPTLLTYSDGRIQMLCRTKFEENGYVAQSSSDDGGLTWSPLSATNLPNNNSGLDGVALADGRQLLVYNHTTRSQPGMGHKGRGMLNVATSQDGVDWNAAVVLDYLDQPGRQFSYPSVIQTADGLVHIVYTWHRQRIKHVVLDPNRLETIPMPQGKWPQHVTAGFDIQWPEG